MQRSKIGPGEKNGQTKYQANINESKSAYHAVLAISKCHTVNENTKSSFAEKDAISQHSIKNWETKIFYNMNQQIKL